jgi:hypothetical protein
MPYWRSSSSAAQLSTHFAHSSPNPSVRRYSVASLNHVGALSSTATLPAAPESALMDSGALFSFPFETFRPRGVGLGRGGRNGGLNAPSPGGVLAVFWLDDDRTGVGAFALLSPGVTSGGFRAEDVSTTSRVCRSTRQGDVYRGDGAPGMEEFSRLGVTSAASGEVVDGDGVEVAGASCVGRLRLSRIWRAMRVLITQQQQQQQ